MCCWSWRQSISCTRFQCAAISCMTFTCTHRVPPKKKRFAVCRIFHHRNNECVLTCTTDDNNFCCAVLSFPHFFPSLFFLLLPATPYFQCVSYHGGARIFYLYVKSDRKEVYHEAAKHTETEMTEWETECNQFFFTLRLLFSLKERTCALSLHCLCACMLFFLVLFLLWPNKKTKNTFSYTRVFICRSRVNFKVKHTHTQSTICTHANELAERKLGSFNENMCVCVFFLSVEYTFLTGFF